MEKNKPLISIIVPCFNSEKYINNCLESVLSNSGDYFEVIVIDDGSTDNTENYVKKISSLDNRVNFIKKKNGGVSSTRNTGIASAKGEYILFLDSDDTLPENCLESYRSHIINNPNVDIFFGKTEYKISNKIRKGSFPKILKTGCVLKNEKYAEVLDHYIARDGIQYSSLSKLFRLHVIKNNNVKFDETMSFCEDVLFNIKYFNFCKTAFLIDTYTYTVTLDQENKSLTRRYNPNQIECLEKTYDSFLLLRQKNEFGSSISKSNIDNRFASEILDVMFRIYSGKYTNLSKRQKREEINKIFDNNILKSIIVSNKKEKNFLCSSFPEKLFKTFCFNKIICNFVLRTYYSLRKIL